jgi:AdoMet-dependent rRNA methyltransferase SPB1
VAKEQGLRSRAAFKLSQINRKFPVLEKANYILDLCAAPGGWTQIAARTCRSDTKIIAVDILPIRSFKGKHSNITTLLGDITTDKCKSDIQHALAKNPCQVVLHDGAPNVGADYGKDAYEQNEISLHALKCATQHLVRGGTFITKIYRSRDYAAFSWLLQQLFGEVQAFKPKASRAQSAEIFLVCQDYKAPAKLDPRMLDPKYVFAAVEGETTGGDLAGAGIRGDPNMTVFHKNWDKKVRKRGGYDMDHFDASMRHVETVESFISAAGMKEAIQVLSTSTGLRFQCALCKEEKPAEAPKCSCNYYLDHPLTTPEIKDCVSDLQVLNKADFKNLLTWRTKMVEAVKGKTEQEREEAGDGESDGAASDEDSDDDADADADADSDKEEEQIQGEIAAMRQRRLREQKKRKKKERAAAGKRRRQAALGMDLNAIDVPDHDKIFSLASITSKGGLEAVNEVNLDEVTDEQIFGGSDDDIVVDGVEEDEDSDVEMDRLNKRERDLDDAYTTYLQNTPNGLAKSGTKFAKRSKKAQRQKGMQEAEEDQEMALEEPEHVSYNAKTYAKMLQGPQDSDDEDQSSDEEDDDGFGADPMTPAEYAERKQAKKRTGDANPLIHQFQEESTSVKTARWFSNPLFATMGKTAQSAAAAQNGRVDADDEGLDSEDESGSEMEPKMKKAKKTKSDRIDPEDVIASMPKTDKEIRHERRLKTMARDERKKTKRAKKLGETEADFELVPAEDGSDDEDGNQKLDHLSVPQRKKVQEARDLIKAGMGTMADPNDAVNSKIEVVASEAGPLPIMDSRKYDSANEDYDSDDYAQTLALGTMMLRRSKEKALVDASYNRYAWNDPQALPEWFVDDENKHYRPQLPIPPALIAKMKEKMLALSSKPIKKVAEARARKNKRAKVKLAAGKKQAEAVANSADMSEAMKLKAISKALRGKESKKPGKAYVVAKKGRGGNGPKGAKLVDKRLKSDTRGEKRKEKKKKGGGRK